MRDLKALTGPKVYFETVEEIHLAVRDKFPEAIGQGSMGAWSWSVNDRLVCEAWLHATNPGWWARIKSDD